MAYFCYTNWFRFCIEYICISVWHDDRPEISNLSFIECQKLTLCVLYILCIEQITYDNCFSKKKKIKLSINSIENDHIARILKQINKTRRINSAHKYIPVYTFSKFAWIVINETKASSVFTLTYLSLYTYIHNSTSSEVKQSNVWNWFQNWLRKGFGWLFAYTQQYILDCTFLLHIVIFIRWWEAKKSEKKRDNTETEYALTIGFHIPKNFNYLLI